MDLLERARKHSWYHTLELVPGEWTDGWFDLREAVPHYGLPDDMGGMRALDVGTWDGFWAFEMESRGAEVVAIDLDDERALDWPARLRPERFPAAARGEGFAIAHELRGSRVRREVCSIYDATPQRLGGEFDLVLCGSVLIHLRDPVLALERIAALCRDRFISAEAYAPLLSLLPMPLARFYGHRKSFVFWQPNVRAWRRMIWGAGFDVVEQRAKFRAKLREGRVPHVVIHAHKSGGQAGPSS